MWKKTLLALATVAALAGFGTVADTAPAAAQQGMHRPLPPRMHAQGPRFGGMHQVRPEFRYGPPRHPHWRGDRWDGRRWGGHRWYGSGVRFYPPGLYGYSDGYSECRIVRKRVRIETDYGWRWGWRKVRYCD